MPEVKYITVRVRADTAEALRGVRRDLMLRGVANIPKHLQAHADVSSFAGIFDLAVAALEHELRAPKPKGEKGGKT